MNIRQIFNKVTNQWPAKVICLIIAIFLYVFHQISLIDKKTFAVPLTIAEDGIVMHVGELPKAISVVVRSSSNNMKLISINDINAVVDLNTLTAKGKYKLPVNLKLSDQLLTLDPFEIKLKEEFVDVEVDRKTVKFVQLEPSIVGNVAHGYEIKKVDLNPSSVLLTGPESILNTTDLVHTGKINVSNAEKTFSVETDYLEMTRAYQVDNKGPYKATVIVVPSVMERDYVNVPVEILNLSDKFKIDGQEPLISLRLSGNVLILEKYNLSTHAVKIDLSEVTEPGTYEIPVTINLPGNIQLVAASDEKFSLKIIRKEVESAE